jgi:hypothetical protein
MNLITLNPSPKKTVLQNLKVIVAGSRTFNDYNLLKTKLDHLLKNQTNIEIVSGTAKGADRLGEKYAQEKGYKLTQFPADWQLGNHAGFLRNLEMAKYATHAVIFWDYQSMGTAHMINLCQKHKLNYRIIKF